MIILEENFKWHLEAFASELYWFIFFYIQFCNVVQVTTFLCFCWLNQYPSLY